MAVTLDAREVNDSSLEADYRRVRPVVRAQLRKNVLDSPFDGVFCNAEVICNLLVRVPVGDQAQNSDFCWCEGLIAHMLGDFE